MTNRFVARKGLLSLGDSTFSEGLSADKAWDLHLNNGVVLTTATAQGKFLLITIDGTKYTLPLYNFTAGVGTMIIEDSRDPIRFTVS